MGHYLYPNALATNPTITSGISNSDGSFTLNSVTGLPTCTTASGDWFYGTLESELVKITDVNTSTKVCTMAARGVDGTTAASHASGVSFKIVESHIGIKDVKNSVCEVGTWANRPTTYDAEKRLYLPTDAFVKHIYHDSVNTRLVYITPYGSTLTPVGPASAYASVGTAGTYGQFTDQNGKVTLRTADNNGEYFFQKAHGLTPPWRIIIGFLYSNREVGNCDAGLVLTDGSPASNRYLRLFIRGSRLYLEKNNSLNSFNSGYFGNAAISINANPFFVEIYNDNTNINYNFGASIDGLSPKTVFSHAKTDFTNAITHYGPYVGSTSTDGEPMVEFVYESAA